MNEDNETSEPRSIAEYARLLEPLRYISRLEWRQVSLAPECVMRGAAEMRNQ